MKFVGLAHSYVVVLCVHSILMTAASSFLVAMAEAIGFVFKIHLCNNNDFATTTKQKECTRMQE